MRREKSCAILDGGAWDDGRPFVGATGWCGRVIAPKSIRTDPGSRFQQGVTARHLATLRPDMPSQSGLLTRRDTLGTASQCVIFVDGLRARHGGSPADSPMPLADMAGVPFLEILIGEASRRGFTRILLLASRGASAIVDFAGQLDRSRRFCCRIEVLVVPGQVGTAGALRFAAPRLEEQFALLDGQAWFDFNWLDLAFALLSMPSVAAILALRHEPEALRDRTVVLDGEKVVSFEPCQSNTGRLVNAGVLVCRRTVLEHLPAAGALETAVLPRLAAEGRLGGRVYDGFYVDIGVATGSGKALAEVQLIRQRPAAFLDRDGVLNIDHGYVHQPQQLTWIPGAVAAVKWLNDHGFYVFVITNQAGVARGYFSEDDVRQFHAHLADELRGAGASIDDFRFCPHHPEATVTLYRTACHWRKPQPGMILDLMQHWPIVVHRSFVIGDKCSDIQAAAAAGIRGYRFTPGDLRDLVQSIDKGAAS
jgi:D,D-heptose 1,7-bisphosphate phosphatase